jgi:hypothetical protein
VRSDGPYLRTQPAAESGRWVVAALWFVGPFAAAHDDVLAGRRLARDHVAVLGRHWFAAVLADVVAVLVDQVAALGEGPIVVRDAEGGLGLCFVRHVAWHGSGGSRFVMLRHDLTLPAIDGGQSSSVLDAVAHTA